MDQIVPLPRSNRGKKSYINEEYFLNLIKKHYSAFKAHGSMLPLNHEIITEFSEKLGLNKKAIYQKIKKYVEAIVLHPGVDDSSFDKSNEIENSLREEEDEEEEHSPDVIEIRLSENDKKNLRPLKRDGESRCKMPENWTFKLAELLWDADPRLKVACAFVFANGNIINNELNTIAHCKECNKSLKIWTEMDFAKVMVKIESIGDEKAIHLKKRKITKDIRSQIGNELKNTASSVYRNKMAREKMKPFDPIPATIANKGKPHT